MNASAITTTMESHDHHQTRGLAAQVWSFVWHFLEMQVPMEAGGIVFALLVRQILAPSSYATAIHPGTVLYLIGQGVFMTFPMLAWMIFRGHGWRHSAEMVGAMLAPVAVIIVLVLLGADAYVPWLAKVGCLAMCLGMLAIMLYRREHYTGHMEHSAHAAHMTR